MLCIFQEIKQSFFLPVNFLNKDILEPWKTFLPYFNCIKTVSTGRKRWKRENERVREKERGREGGSGRGMGGRKGTGEGKERRTRRRGGRRRVEEDGEGGEELGEERRRGRERRKRGRRRKAMIGRLFFVVFLSF